VPRAWAIWLIFAIVVVTSRGAERPAPGNVFGVYRDAAMRWSHGEPLYDGTGGGFIYLPHAAVLFMPFTLLSWTGAAAAWRLVNVGVFAIGVWSLTGLVRRDQPRLSWLLVSVPVVLLSWSAARHGQMTLTMGGLMLLAVVDVCDRRWWRATVWLILATALKPLSAVLVLLAAALYPRTSWRLAVGALAAAALPFLAQQPAYVLEQYRQGTTALRVAAEVGVEQEFAQLFWMLKSAGLGLAPRAETLIRMLAAALTFAVCWHARRRGSPAQAGLLLFTLAAGYLLLFNPRTERNTYCLLSPALAVFGAQAVAAGRRARSGLFFGLALALLVSYPLGKLLTGGPTVWLKPLVSMIFLAAVLGDVARGSWRSPSLEATAPTTWAAWFRRRP